jgi:hypothetical protein
LLVDDALLTLSSSKASPEASAIAVPGPLSISTSSNPAAEHAISTEAVLNILTNTFTLLGAAISALGPPLAALAPVFAPPGGAATLALAVLAAASGPTSTLDSGVAGAIAAVFTGAQQMPPGAPGVGQTKPGIGCAGSFLG